MNKSRILVFILSFLLVLFFQNCSMVDNSTLSSQSKDLTPIQNAIDSGNGGGYTGISIESKTYIQPGETTNVKILGGKAPYTLTASHSDVLVSSTPLENEFEITLLKQTQIISFNIEATDGSGQKVQKSIWIDFLRVNELNSPNSYIKAGNLGTSLALNSQLAVLNGKSFVNDVYAEGGLFVFSHNEESIERIDQNQLLTSIDRRHYAEYLEMNEDYLATSQLKATSTNKNRMGSVSLYKLNGNSTPQLVDQILPPTINYLSYFGTDLSLHKNLLAVSRTTGFTQLGLVHLYQMVNDKAKLVQSIKAPSLDHYNFGMQVKLTDQHLFVVSNHRTPIDPYNPNYNSHVVHVYKKTVNRQWEPEQEVRLMTHVESDWRHCGYTLEATDNRFMTICYWNKKNESTGFYDQHAQLLIYKKSQTDLWQMDQTIDIPIHNNKSLLFYHYYSHISLDQGLLALSTVEPTEQKITVYHLNEQDQFQPWKQLIISNKDIDSTNTLTFMHSKFQLSHNKILISINTIDKAFSLLVNIDQLPTHSESE